MAAGLVVVRRSLRRFAVKVSGRTGLFVGAVFKLSVEESKYFEFFIWRDVD